MRAPAFPQELEGFASPVELAEHFVGLYQDWRERLSAEAQASLPGVVDVMAHRCDVRGSILVGTDQPANRTSLVDWQCAFRLNLTGSSVWHLFLAASNRDHAGRGVCFRETQLRICRHASQPAVIIRAWPKDGSRPGDQPTEPASEVEPPTIERIDCEGPGRFAIYDDVIQEPLRVDVSQWIACLGFVVNPDGLVLMLFPNRQSVIGRLVKPRSEAPRPEHQAS